MTRPPFIWMGSSRPPRVLTMIGKNFWAISRGAATHRSDLKPSNPPALAFFTCLNAPSSIESVGASSRRKVVCICCLLKVAPLLALWSNLAVVVSTPASSFAQYRNQSFSLWRWSLACSPSTAKPGCAVASLRKRPPMRSGRSSLYRSVPCAASALSTTDSTKLALSAFTSSRTTLAAFRNATSPCRWHSTRIALSKVCGLELRQRSVPSFQARTAARRLSSEKSSSHLFKIILACFRLVKACQVPFEKIPPRLSFFLTGKASAKPACSPSCRRCQCVWTSTSQDGSGMSLTICCTFLLPSGVFMASQSYCWPLVGLDSSSKQLPKPLLHDLWQAETSRCQTQSSCYSPGTFRCSLRLCSPNVPLFPLGVSRTTWGQYDDPQRSKESSHQCAQDSPFLVDDGQVLAPILPGTCEPNLAFKSPKMKAGPTLRKRSMRCSSCFHHAHRIVSSVPSCGAWTTKKTKLLPATLTEVASIRGSEKRTVQCPPWIVIGLPWDSPTLSPQCIQSSQPWCPSSPLLMIRR